MVSNSSTGIQILLTSAAHNNPISSASSVNIPNHYLPPECDNSNRCSILHFESFGLSYYIIPSIRGFVILSHIADHTAIQTTFITITEECNPTKAFYDGPAEGRTTCVYNIVVACTDLQTQPQGIIYYLQYRFFPNSTGSGRGLIMRNYEQLTQSEPIYTPGNMSEIVFVRGQQRCAEYDNLYFIDATYIVHYPFNAFDPEFINSNNALQNCPVPYKGIEYYGNDTIVIRCSNNQAVFYDSCASRFTYPASTTSVPYPCTNWDNIVYHNGSKLILHRKNHGQAMPVTLNLPFGNLNYGKCIQVGNMSTFIGTSADGEIFIAPFNVGTDSRVINISSGSSFKASNRLVLSENEQAFGVFDPTTYTLVVINLTQTCNVINISASFMPALISISQGQGIYNCSCREMQSQSSLSYFTTAALKISTEDDRVIMSQLSIPLIAVVLGTTVVLVVMAIIFVMLMIT
jgi:hypothetical protein